MTNSSDFDSRFRSLQGPSHCEKASLCLCACTLMCGCMHVCVCALALPVWPRLSGVPPLSGGNNIQASWKDATAGTDAHNATQCIPTMQCNEPRVGCVSHTCVFHSLRAGEEPEPRRRIVASICASGALKSGGLLLAAAAALARERVRACASFGSACQC